MKILVLGDVVGRPGRNFLSENLNSFKQRENVDFCIANGENAAGGSGLTAKTAHVLKSAGVDLLTLGDHVWDQKNFDNEIDDLNFVCRPANLPESNPKRSNYIHCGRIQNCCLYRSRTLLHGAKGCMSFQDG